MKTVKQLLQAKHSDIWTVTPEISTSDAAKLMADKGIGALLVIESGKLVGIISERDYLRRLILPGKSPHATPVREIMTPNVIYIQPEQTAEECMALMTEKHIRHLPVMQHGRLLGLISMRDVVRDLISEKEFVIEQLANYITTGY